MLHTLYVCGNQKRPHNVQKAKRGKGTKKVMTIVSDNSAPPPALYEAPAC
jgi:hypothetical protein